MKFPHSSLTTVRKTPVVVKNLKKIQRKGLPVHVWMDALSLFSELPEEIEFKCSSAERKEKPLSLDDHFHQIIVADVKLIVGSKDKKLKGILSGCNGRQRSDYPGEWIYSPVRLFRPRSRRGNNTNNSKWRQRES